MTLGARFDDRVTGKVATFAPNAKVIHVDIDPAELGKVRQPDVPIVGDCKIVIDELIKAVKRRAGEARAARPLRVAARRCGTWQEQFPLKYTQEEGGPLKPQYCIETLRDNTPDDTILVSGVGQHQMWASQLWKFKLPNTWINSGGLGTMGYAVPGRGRRQGRPARPHGVGVDGDGCFQMTAQELVTAAAERIPMKIAILNNAYLGMVRQWQELFYEERYSEVYLSPDLPDYVKWAEAMGCVGMPRRQRRRRRADDREGQRDRRPPGRDRLPHRLPREGVPDGARGLVERRHHPRPRVRRRGQSMSNGWSPHPHGARREQAGCAVARRRPVLAARVQHRLARGQPDRRRALQPHDDRRRRRVGAARAGREAAQQAHPRHQDHRAAADRGCRARVDDGDGEGDGRSRGLRSPS